MEQIKAFFKKPFFSDYRVLFGLWMILAVVSHLLKFWHERNNNYLIFKYVYWHTIQGKSLYALSPTEFKDCNHYGPFFSLIIAPFAVLPDFIGMLLWLLVLTLVLYYAIRKLPTTKRVQIFILWFAAHELLTALFMQQFNIATAAMILATFTCIEKEKDGWAAFWIVVGTFVKLYANDHMKMALEKNRGISAANKIFGFGHAVSSSPKDRQAFFYTWDLRFDLYKQLGCPEIKDLNDLAKVLADMKKICPTDDNGKETYGLSLFPDWDGNMVMFVKSLGTAYYGWDEFGFGLYDPETGKYHPCLEPGGAYLESLKFINSLYQKGLLDPDSQTQNYDAMNENYKNGTAFFNIFNWMASGSYNTQEHNEAGKGMYSVRPTKASPIVYGQSVYGGNRVWSIGAKTQYPELCMAILNWFSTPEGFMTCQYGPKGITWDYDKDGKTYFTDLGKKCQADNNTAMPAPYNGLYKDGTFQINNTTWGLDASNPDSNGETYNKASWASEATPAKFQVEQEWRDWAKATSTEDYLGKGKFVVAPASDYSGAPMDDELKVKWNQVATCIKSNTWKAIYAKNDAEFDKIVADMTAEAKSYGYDECNAFQEKEAIRRKAAEDKAAGLAVETPAETTTDDAAATK